MLLLSNAASTSSKTKKGAGQKLGGTPPPQNKDTMNQQPRNKGGDGGFDLGKPPYLWMANSRAKAAMAFSPPDRLSMDVKRFPGATQQ